MREATARWVRDAEALIRHGQDTGAITSTVAATDAAERLTALVEGLSERWLAGSLPLERARFLLRSALALELGPQPPRPARGKAARVRPARAHSRTPDAAE